MLRPAAVVIRWLASVGRSRRELLLENIALRQQLATMVQRNRPRIRFADRVFWIVLRRVWARWAEVLVIVKPETVVGWHRAGFRLYWQRLSRRGSSSDHAAPSTRRSAERTLRGATLAPRDRSCLAAARRSRWPAASPASARCLVASPQVSVVERDRLGHREGVDGGDEHGCRNDGVPVATDPLGVRIRGCLLRGCRSDRPRPLRCRLRLRR